MKYLLVSLFLVLFIFPSQVFAISDPLAVPNNKYGIHIIDENDLDSAAALVNSSGGDWGYVTIVMAEHERNRDKWQNAFDRMKFLHLIPLVRVATHIEGTGWVKPHETDVNEWVEFLSSLRWPVQNKYVILFNEPNHAKEWGGDLNPEEYARIFSAFASSLKAHDPDFYILPAGMDASAPNAYETMDEQQYVRRMILAAPEILDLMDGWTSHSYPNPGFAGRVTDNGKGTLRTFLWEKRFLKTLGLTKELPIFITETGWPHQEGPPAYRFYYSANDVSEMIQHAAETVWTDPTIVAITPFILNYPAYPFSNFSWQKPNGATFYPQFDSYRSLVKTAGVPIVPTSSPTVTPTPTKPPVANRVLSAMTERSSEEQPFLSSVLSRIQAVFSAFL